MDGIFDRVYVNIPKLDKTLFILVDDRTEVREVKIRVGDLESIPFEKQELVYKDIILENINTLVSYKIKRGETITLNILDNVIDNELNNIADNVIEKE